MSNVIALRPSQRELEAAWEAYDRARIHLESLYALPLRSTEKERFDAAMEVLRLHREFVRLGRRMEVRG